MKENTVTASQTCQSLALALAQPVWQLLDILWILESNGQRNPTFFKTWLTAPCLFQNKRPTKNDTTPRERSNPETLDGPQSCLRLILGFWGILSCKEIQIKKGIEHSKYFKIQSARGLVPLHCAKATSQSRFEYLAIYNSYSTAIVFFDQFDGGLADPQHDHFTPILPDPKGGFKSSHWSCKWTSFEKSGPRRQYIRLLNTSLPHQIATIPWKPQDCQVQLKLALGLITVSKIFKGPRGKHWTGPVRRCEELSARSCRILPSNWLQNQVLVNANYTGQQQSTNCRAKTKQSLRWRCPAKVPESRRLIGNQRMVKPSCSHQRPKCPCQEKKRHLATTSTSTMSK